MMNLKIIHSTRPAPEKARHSSMFVYIAAKHTISNTKLLDLAAYQPAAFDEQEASPPVVTVFAIFTSAIFVLRCQNILFPATIKNAIDFIYERNYKKRWAFRGGVSKVRHAGRSS